MNTVDLDFNEWGPMSDGVRAVRAEVNVPGLTVELGGDIFSDGVKPPATEAFGLLAAVIILLVAFGSVLAMGLPIVTALFGIGIGIAVVELLANVMPRPRLHDAGRGDDRRSASASTTRCSSSPATARPCTTACDPKTRSLAVDQHRRARGRVRGPHGRHLPSRHVPHGRAASCAASPSAAASPCSLMMVALVTLLPALLGFVGLNIDRFGLPHRKKHEAAAAQKESLWHRWSRTVQRRPWPAAIAGGLLILVLLAAPFFSLRLGFGRRRQPAHH